MISLALESSHGLADKERQVLLFACQISVNCLLIGSDNLLDDGFYGTCIRYKSETVVGNILFRISTVKECFLKRLLT